MNNGFTFRLGRCEFGMSGKSKKETGSAFKNMLCSSEARKGEKDHPLLGSFRDNMIPGSARSTAKLSECSLLSGDS